MLSLAILLERHRQECLCYWTVCFPVRRLFSGASIEGVVLLRELFAFVLCCGKEIGQSCLVSLFEGLDELFPEGVELPDRDEEGRSVLQQDSLPQIGVPGGDPGGVPETAADELCPVRLQGGGKSGSEEVGQVAGGGQDFVVLFRRKFDHIAADCLPKVDQTLQFLRRSPFGRGDDAGFVLEQIRYGRCVTLLFGPRDRVGPDEGDSKR